MFVWYAGPDYPPNTRNPCATEYDYHRQQVTYYVINVRYYSRFKAKISTVKRKKKTTMKERAEERDEGQKLSSGLHNSDGIYGGKRKE
jgi:hypothetical protein